MKSAARRPKEKPRRDFDALIVGGGQAGIPLAHSLAGAGWRVALAERRHLGGSCVNFGCTPTKAVLSSARVASLARRGAAYGLRIPKVDVDFLAVLARARSLVEQSRGALLRSFEGGADANPALLKGTARLDGREGAFFRVIVGESLHLARRVVVDTGTRSVIPEIPGLFETGFLDAGNWLYGDTRPEHVVFIGAGFVGLEMSQFYRRLGSRICILEKSKRILSREDADVAAALHACLESEGIEFRVETQATRVRRLSRHAIEVETDSPLGKGVITASHVFVASGRRPNTFDLGLATVGLRLPRSGFVPVNERLETPVAGIYAAGDVRGGPMFTHTSWDDYRVLESQLVGKGERTTNRVVPWAIFTDPELGRVGMTTREARRATSSLAIGRFEMRSSSKARERGETRGFVKLLVDAKKDRFLGAAVLASEGAELVHLLVALMAADAPASVVGNAIAIHPTLAEAVQSAALAAQPAGRRKGRARLKTRR